MLTTQEQLYACSHQLQKREITSHKRILGVTSEGYIQYVYPVQQAVFDMEDRQYLAVFIELGIRLVYTNQTHTEGVLLQLKNLQEFRLYMYVCVCVCVNYGVQGQTGKRSADQMTFDVAVSQYTSIHSILNLPSILDNVSLRTTRMVFSLCYLIGYFSCLFIFSQPLIRGSGGLQSKLILINLPTFLLRQIIILAQQSVMRPPEMSQQLYLHKEGSWHTLTLGKHRKQPHLHPAGSGLVSPSPCSVDV